MEEERRRRKKMGGERERYKVIERNQGLREKKDTSRDSSIGRGRHKYR